jgi:basic membrane protein A and related proteins
VRHRCLTSGLLLLVAACGGGSAARTATTRPVKVGLVFDVGGRGDGSFNDQAAAGAERAARTGGVTVEYADAHNDAERSAGLRRFAAEGVDLVIGVGFLASQDATELARRYPGVRFAVVDYSLPVDSAGRAMVPPPNLAALTFREEEGSYLVGALAALASRTHAVGFVGGMRSPLITKFEAGYEAGVRRVCADCRVLSEYVGDTPEAFRDAPRARTLAASEYAAGADVVFHAAGQSGTGVFAAATDAGRLVIGVDVDQHAAAPGRVLTSMVKRLDVAVADVIDQVHAGEFHGGMHSYGLAEGGVAYVADATTAAHVNGAARDRVETLRAGIVAGLVRVPTAR